MRGRMLILVLVVGLFHVPRVVAQTPHTISSPQRRPAPASGRGPLHMRKTPRCISPDGRVFAVPLKAAQACAGQAQITLVNQFYASPPFLAAMNLVPIDVAAMQPYVDDVIANANVVVNSSKTAAPGTPISVSAILPPGVAIPVIEYHQLSLDFILKGNLFADTVLANRLAEQSMPIFDLTAANAVTSAVACQTTGSLPTGVVCSNTQNIGSYGRILTDSVPGWLGQLYGQVPVVTELQPTLDVTWTIRNENGTLLDEGRHYKIVNGATTDPNVGIVIRPSLVELTNKLPTVTYTITAEVKACVTLESGSPVCSERDIDTQAEVAAIPVPTMLVMFANRNFSGRWMVVVPKNSPIGDHEELKDAVETLKKAVDAVNNVGGVATLLLPDVAPHLATVISALNGTPAVFEDKDEIPHFTAYSMQGPSITNDWNGADADDYFNSVIYVSYGRRVWLYNEKEYNKDDGDEAYFKLSEDDGAIGIVALIADLGKKRPDLKPTSGLVAGKLSRHDDDDNEQTFINKLSSMKFAR